ncbi:MAG: acetyl-coenzyme A synthetase, partial [Oceanospirillaceae bacterium]|nr:acetyl-coenzyme A synthetase [Oceanospirillaceae bacterium]
MSDQKVYPVKPEFADSAWINNEKYLQMYQQSVINPEGFWREQAEQRIDWIKPFTRVRNVSFDDHNVNIKWFEDGTLNASANCLDRHLETRGDQTAIIWEGDDPGQDRHITYKELHEEVSRFANALRGQGVRKGDIVCIYMPMIPEAAVAML